MPDAAGRRLIDLLAASAPSDPEIADTLVALARERSLSPFGNTEKAIPKLAELLDRLGASAELAGHVALRLDLDARPDDFSEKSSAPWLGRYDSKRIYTYAKHVAEPGVVPTAFELALADLASRRPLVARDLALAVEDVKRIYSGYRDPISHRRVHPRGFAAAEAISEVVARRVRNEVVAGLRARRTVGETAERIAAREGWARGYAHTVVQTNVTTGFSAGRHRQAELLRSRGVTIGFEYQTAGDERVRDSHRALDGLVAASDHPIWAHFTPPLDYNCFPADTLVQGTFEGAFRALYSGDMIQIETKGGRRLSVTPNHPVLTVDGFVPAGALRESDRLLCYDERVAPTEGIDEEKRPARIEEAFRSLSERLPVSTARGRTIDFHGDAAWFQGDIEIVLPEGVLLNDHETSLADLLGDFTLVTPSARKIPGPRARRHFERSKTRLPTARSFPSGLALTDDERTAHPTPLHPLCLGSASRIDTSRKQPVSDDVTADLEFVRELLLRDSEDSVRLDDIIYVERYRLASGSIQVYDLQSPHGWIVAQGIFTSNCRCQLLPVTDERRFRVDALWLARERGARAEPGFGTKPHRGDGRWPPREAPPETSSP